MSQTFGQQRVRATFNPSDIKIVDRIKEKSAELIDLIEAITPGDSHADTNPDSTKFHWSNGNEVHRLKRSALDNIEIGCMLAVKAATTPDEYYPYDSARNFL